MVRKRVKRKFKDRCWFGWLIESVTLTPPSTSYPRTSTATFSLDNCIYFCRKADM